MGFTLMALEDMLLLLGFQANLRLRLPATGVADCGGDDGHGAGQLAGFEEDCPGDGGLQTVNSSSRSEDPDSRGLVSANAVWVSSWRRRAAVIQQGCSSWATFFSLSLRCSAGCWEATSFRWPAAVPSPAGKAGRTTPGRSMRSIFWGPASAQSSECVFRACLRISEKRPP